jgi:hypothetical protein
MLRCKFLIILLLALVESIYGASLNNLPTYPDDPEERTDARLFPVYNFSFYPTKRKVVPMHVPSHIPSCSTEPVVSVPKIPMQKGLALLYICSRIAHHEYLAKKLIKRCNQETVGSMQDMIVTMLNKLRKPITITLLMPSFMIHGRCYSVKGKTKCEIQRLSTREIVIFGKGVCKRKIAYQKWLALSAQLGNDGGDVYLGTADMISTSVQLTDIHMTLPNNVTLCYKVPSPGYTGMYSMKTAQATLIASTCKPEITADLLRTQLHIFHEKSHTNLFFSYALEKLIVDNSFLDSVFLQLSVKNEGSKPIECDTFRVFREDGYIKGRNWSNPDDDVKYPIFYKDPCIEVECRARLTHQKELSIQ